MLLETLGRPDTVDFWNHAFNYTIALLVAHVLFETARLLIARFRRH